MKRILVIVGLLFVIYIQQKWKFYGRFDQMHSIPEIPTLKAIPLWYPYFMVKEWRGDVRLDSIESWETPGPDRCWIHERPVLRTSCFADDNQILDGILLGGVDGVQEFRFGNGVLAGKRVVKGESIEFFSWRPGPRMDATAFFVFATNMEKAVQFRSRAAYLEKCREYGVDGNCLKNFDENFKDYKAVRDSASGFLNVVRTNFASGVSTGEWAFLIVCGVAAILVISLKGSGRSV